MSKRTNKILSVLLALTLAIASMSLVACGGGSTQEQDNCYGEDMPVMNE